VGRPGKWLAIYRDHLGIRRWKTFDTYREADAYLDERKRETRQATPGVSVDPNITVDQYADKWLEEIKATVEPRTLESYRQLLRLHIRPAFGALKLRSLHRGHIRSLLAAKRAPKAEGEKGLGKNTVRLIRATLSVMLGDAAEDGLLVTNPVRDVERRRGRKRADAITSAERQKKITPLSVDQLAKFLAKADALVRQGELARRDATLFLTLADAGLRPGEGLALRWEDVDIASRTLTVERAVSSGQVKSTKTGGSRTVDMTVRLADALSQWQATCEANALTESREVLPWMFPSGAGTPLDEAKVAKRYRSILLAAKLPRFRLYDLRHSYATHLLALGAPITYVSAQLGHTKPTTTL
ncbi:MAG: site-specific integrase, partial [Acidobacteria bacterium]|nr:site-specific integrase [Acidobacteriota bacterium]